MSAHVFKPVGMSEFRRLVNRNAQSDQANEGKALARVRRNLFGPVSQEESRAFVDKELASIHARDQEKWGFDFIKEKPVTSAKYFWQRVSPRKDKVPEPYALGRLPYLKKSTDVSPSSKMNLEKPNRSRTVVKQSKITDFLKNRKRSSISLSGKPVDSKIGQMSLPSKKKKNSEQCS